MDLWYGGVEVEREKHGGALQGYPTVKWWCVGMMWRGLLLCCCGKEQSFYFNLVWLTVGYYGTAVWRRRNNGNTVRLSCSTVALCWHDVV